VVRIRWLIFLSTSNEGWVEFVELFIGSNFFKVIGYLELTLLAFEKCRSKIFVLPE